VNPDTDNPNAAQLDLSQLRDIHMPEPTSWWPLAPGWWILLGILLLVLTGFWLLHRYRQRNAWRRDALARLAVLQGQHQSEACQSQQLVSELSVILRRVAVSRFPREESASLSGEEWLAFLEQQCRKETSFQSEVGRLLIVAPYALATSITSDEMNSLFELCRDWISKLPAGGRL